MSLSTCCEPGRGNEQLVGRGKVDHPDDAIAGQKLTMTAPFNLEFDPAVLLEP